MKADNLIKLSKISMIYDAIPNFIVLNNIKELNLNELCRDKIYAVRSSCDIEDNANSSFAGQFKTFLNVNISEIKDKSEQVFDSFSPYKGKVIIQEMIDSDISGVVFTANPVGILNEMVVVAGYGLGDKVVEDKIDTSTYYYNIDDKLYYTEGEDIVGENILKDILNYALIIKSVLGYEVDVEFAVKNNKIFILQARPITTLSNTDGKIILDNSNIVEGYPGISLPLTQDFVQEIYYKVFKRLVLRITANTKLVNKMDSNLQYMTDITNGRVYYRIDNWYRVLKLLPFSNKIIAIWQEMLGVQNKEVNKLEDVSILVKMRVILSFIYLIIASPSKMKKLNNYFNNKLAKYNTNIIDSNTNDELIKTYEIILKDLTDVWDITLVNDMYSFIFTHLSREKDKLANIKNLESMKPVMALNNLVLIYKTEGITDNYLKLEQEYIRKYGDRCPEELKLETKTYRTNPELLRNYVETSDVIDINASKNNTKDRLFVKLAKKGIYNREISRMNRTRIFGLTREIMLKIGNNLVKDGIISNDTDVFYLYYNEIKNIKHNINYKEFIQERKQLYESYKQLPNYTRLVFKDRVIHKNVNNCKVNILNKSNILQGTASSNGKVTGEVIIVDKPNIGIDTSNKIIVTRTTDPGWVFLIKNSLGIITEKGSILSHTAIITRELNKPSVVNVKDVTNIVNNGDIVEVDGFKGVVTIIERM